MTVRPFHGDREIERAVHSLPFGLMLVHYVDDGSAGLVFVSECSLKDVPNGEHPYPPVEASTPDTEIPERTLEIVGREGTFIDMGPNEGTYRVSFTTTTYMSPEEYKIYATGGYRIRVSIFDPR